MEVTSIAEQLLFTTVRIEARIPSGEYVGTGFIFNYILKGLDAVEEVLFIGYPCGIWDARNLLPIVRRGITATPIYIDFSGRKQFLIDASVFPGSSGSPVFIYNAGIYWDKKSGSTVVGHRLFFLGILSEVFQMVDTGGSFLPQIDLL
jgi:hypothetical protein